MSHYGDVLCFSHLRWGFVYQRPQHLMSRCARDHRLFFIEEPEFDEGPIQLVKEVSAPGVTVCVPHFPTIMSGLEIERAVSELLQELVRQEGISNFVSWYYTPMALGWTEHLNPRLTVFDCMDELTGFLGCPPELRAREAQLIQSADLMFAGGRSLFEAKRSQRPDLHLFPSSIDPDHFRQARGAVVEPGDQAGIPHPRLGYCGVVDERMDLGLLAAVADARPDWQLVIVGPVVKIDPAALPQRPNIHYLGSRAYAELPSFLAGWDVALLPFALNDATRFISPTKTPEYLAAGRPVVSTPIHDVIHPYGDEGMVAIAGSPDAFVAAVEDALRPRPASWLERVDAFLTQSSWDATWDRMDRLIQAAADRRRSRADIGKAVAGHRREGIAAVDSAQEVAHA